MNHFYNARKNYPVTIDLLPAITLAYISELSVINQSQYFTRSCVDSLDSTF